VKLILLSLLFCTSATASISQSISLRSNYILHGVGFSNDTSTVDGTLAWSHKSGFSLGLWTISTTGDSEIDTSLNYAKTFGEFEISVSFIQIQWAKNQKADGQEVDLFINHSLLNLTFKHFTNWEQSSVDSNEHVGINYVAVSKSHGLEKNLSLNWHVGQSMVDEDKDVSGTKISTSKSWTDWGVGVTRTIDSFDISFNYTDTNRTDNPTSGTDETSYEDKRYTVILARSF
jgi:uncharacterized protein (TIGR02001 family)